MRSIIKRAAIVLSVLGGFSLFANEGTVTYLKGKAEVHRNDSWIQLKLGDSVYNSDVISTGFQSEVKINEFTHDMIHFGFPQYDKHGNLIGKIVQVDILFTVTP